MKQILLFSPSNADGCAFYRGIGPLGELRHYDIRIKQCPRQLHWGEISDCDIGFMQRPYSQKHVQIAKMIKQQMPLWIDYDDDLYHVPESNPSYELYESAETKACLDELRSLADVITVSTKGVQDFFGGIVVPNAYNDYRLPIEYKPNPKEKKIVLWRGTKSHQGDLLFYKDQLDSIIANNPNVQFVFFGFYPWMLDTSKGDIVYISGQDIFSFNTILEKINPDVLIVPLEDNLLNRAKSNIAWLEVSRFGTNVVAPAFQEWLIGSIINYHLYDITQFDLVDAFNMAISTERSDYDWRIIQNGLLLFQINKQRLELVKQLCS